MTVMHANSSNTPAGIVGVLTFIWFLLGLSQANGFANTRTKSNTNTNARTKLAATSSHQGGNLPSLPNVKAAVIVPGFLTGKDEFLPLAKSLTAKGIPTVVVPSPNWHWLPCLGGRSMRPMLERIDFTVRHLAAVAGNLSDFNRVTLESLEGSKFTQKDGLIVPKDSAMIQTDNPQLLIPEFDYNLFDLYQDFRNNPGGVLKVGGSAEVEEYPLWDPKGRFKEAPEPMGKVALIGHSAGGWICRAYLSQKSYGGKAYCGNELVHSLITLGSPHGNAPGPAFKGVEWVNRERLDDVRILGVGGTGYRGKFILVKLVRFWRRIRLFVIGATLILL
jgi:triacylglycerol esterase/lipase EstA (alpha/beta hydrolase family)